jgi:hypothetical protein
VRALGFAASIEARKPRRYPGMNEQPLVGTWRLISFHGRNAAGETRPALGKNAQGLLVYTEDGRMIAIMSDTGRASFLSRDFRGGTPDEALAAINSFISYCGTYAVNGQTVTHHVEMSLFPNWVGEDQIRNFKFEGGNLVLSTPPLLLSGKQWTFELAWERVSAP